MQLENQLEILYITVDMYIIQIFMRVNYLKHHMSED